MTQTTITNGKQYLTTIGLQVDGRLTIKDFNRDLGQDVWASNRNGMERNIQRLIEDRTNDLQPNLIVPNLSGDSSIDVTVSVGITLAISNGSAYIRGRKCSIPGGQTHVMTAADGDYYLALHILNYSADESFELVDILQSGWAATPNKENYILLADVTISGTGTVSVVNENFKSELGRTQVMTFTKELKYSGLVTDRLYFQVEPDMAIHKAELRVYMREPISHKHSIAATTGGHTHTTTVYNNWDTVSEANLTVNKTVQRLVANAGSGWYAYIPTSSNTAALNAVTDLETEKGNITPVKAININQDGGSPFAIGVGGAVAEGVQPAGSPYDIPTLTTGQHFIEVWSNDGLAASIGECQVTLRLYGIII